MPFMYPSSLCMHTHALHFSKNWLLRFFLFMIEVSNPVAIKLQVQWGKNNTTVAMFPLNY